MLWSVPYITMYEHTERFSISTNINHSNGTSFLTGTSQTLWGLVHMMLIWRGHGGRVDSYQSGLATCSDVVHVDLGHVNMLLT